MNPISNVIKMHLRDKTMWFFVPWFILFSSFLINLFIGYFFGGKEPIYTGGIASIYIYMFIVGTIILTHTFPFALGFSIRRTDYFLGTSGMAVAVSAVTAILFYLLSIAERLTGDWGVNLHFFHLPYLNDGSAIQQLGVYFILMLHMYFLGFAISSIHRRFGRYGMFAFFIAVILVLSVVGYMCTYYHWWGDIFGWLVHHSAAQIALWMVPLILVYMLVSYLMLRKATVR
ncbi:hypothetical protein ACI7RC_14535 [Brevibacillus sp. B_LB10_24]|uniref:hypothetical protein n=1 Tax=Brevibacillus sp. B_LB10_24 TaxID=3380645 RepID=UPI0038BA63EB